MSKLQRWLIPPLITLLLIIAAGVMAAWGVADGNRIAVASEPYPGTVNRTQTLLFFPETALGAAATTYSASPQTLNGEDITKIGPWNSAEIFVSAQFTTNAQLTVTAQLSPDQIHWADAEYVVDSIATTGPSTDTTASWYQTILPYRTVLITDGVKMFRLPLGGDSLRLKIETTDEITPTIWATLRNN